MVWQFLSTSTTHTNAEMNISYVFIVYNTVRFGKRIDRHLWTVYVIAVVIEVINYELKIWNTNSARATTFSLLWLKGVTGKESNIWRQKSLTQHWSRTSNTWTHVKCSTTWPSLPFRLILRHNVSRGNDDHKEPRISTSPRWKNIYSQALWLPS